MNTGYESVMPVFGSQLSDEEVANVLTYVLDNFNKGGTNLALEAAATRKAGAPE